MTSDGHAYSRFRRALEVGDVHLVHAAALELPQIGLADALRVCLVFSAGSPARYERAAVRWLGRFALEAHGATIDEIRAASAALADLPRAPEDAMERLQRLCVARGVHRR
jgi:hypothetical protein